MKSDRILLIIIIIGLIATWWYMLRNNNYQDRLNCHHECERLIRIEDSLECWIHEHKSEFAQNEALREAILARYDSAFFVPETIPKVEIEITEYNWDDVQPPEEE